MFAGATPDTLTSVDRGQALGQALRQRVGIGTMVLGQAHAEGTPTIKRISFILVAALAAPSSATAAGGPDQAEFYVDGNDVAVAYREPADGGGWRLPTGDAVLLDERWWTPLGRLTPIEAPPITTPAPALLRGIRGDRLTAVTAGDVDRDGEDELVISFRRPFKRNHINITRPRRAWVDDEGLSAHLGLYRADDLSEIWVAGTLVSPVIEVAACNDALAVAYGDLREPGITETGAWRWVVFGFLPTEPLPGPGTPTCVDIDGDGRTEPAIIGRSES